MTRDAVVYLGSTPPCRKTIHLQLSSTFSARARAAAGKTHATATGGIMLAHILCSQQQSHHRRGALSVVVHGLDVIVCEPLRLDGHIDRVDRVKLSLLLPVSAACSGQVG